MIVFACVVQAVDPAASLRQKLAHIESGRLPPHTRVVTTAAEWNAWASEEAAELFPGAIQDVRLTALPEDRITASARVNFLKLSNSRNWLMQELFNGEKPVTVTVHVLSNNGRARVDVERVEVSGVALHGPALDFVIQQYVLPRYPEAEVNRWFALDYGIDHFEIAPAGVTIVMK